MIVMAIEGARQIADPTKEIAGFKVRDVSVGKAMVLHPELPTETKLQFRPWRAGSRLSDSFWHEFTISCRTRQGVWTQHCAGLVAVKYEIQHLRMRRQLLQNDTMTSMFVSPQLGSTLMILVKFMLQ